MIETSFCWSANVLLEEIFKIQLLELFLQHQVPIMPIQFGLLVRVIVYDLTYVHSCQKLVLFISQTSSHSKSTSHASILVYLTWSMYKELGDRDHGHFQQGSQDTLFMCVFKLYIYFIYVWFFKHIYLLGAVILHHFILLC